MSTIIRALRWLIRELGVASGFAVLLIMLTICIDIVGRTFLNAPLWGSTEISVLLLVMLVFLGIARTQQEGQHYRVELLVEHMSPGVRRVSEVVSLIICFVVVATLAWYSTLQGWAAFQKGEVNYGNVPFPIWPARWVIAGGLILISAQFLIDIYTLLRGKRSALAADGDGDGEGDKFNKSV